MVRFGHIELFVRHPLESARFYETRLGCRICEGGSEASVWIAMGDMEILLRRQDEERAAGTYQDADVGIVLYTENLEEEIVALSKRGLEFAGDDGSPREPVFSDPDGHWFQVVDPADFS